VKIQRHPLKGGAARLLATRPASTLRAMARSVVRASADAAYLRAIGALLERSLPFHLVAGDRSRAGWDVPEWALRKATSVTIQAGVGHMLMLEDGAGFLSIVRGSCHRRTIDRGRGDGL